MKKKLVVSIVALLVIALLVVGCGKKEAPAKEEPAKETPAKEEPAKEEPAKEAPAKEEPAKEEPAVLEGKISVVGSTSVSPIMEKLAEAFMAKNKGISVEIQSVGSSAGVEAAHKKTADIGMSSRNLKGNEKEWKLEEVVLGFDGIAVSVHPSNKVTNLTKEQVQQIFTGQITNWKDVGGEDKEIVVVQREAGSGTRGAFEELTDLVDKVSEDALVAEGNGALRSNIATKDNAIGYLSLSYVDDTVKSVSIDGTEATADNIKGEKYSLARPFLLLLNGEKNDVVAAFFTFIGSEEGKAIISEKLVIK